MRSQVVSQERSCSDPAQVAKGERAMPLLICDRPIHPLAKLFPPLSPDEFEKLKADIQRNGQLEPVWLDEEGRVLDGRHRLRACKELGIGATVMRLREIDPKIS